MGNLNNLFNMSPETAQNLTNFGFSTMAASQQPGITTLAALGQGGLGMNQAAQQQAQTQNMQQEGIGKKLNNALALRGLNIGNAAMGLQPVNMSGVPDLLNPQPQQPSGATAGMSWSQTSGAGTPSPTTRTAPANPLMNNLGVTQDVLDVALQKRAPQNRDEAIAAARVAGFMGNTEWQKALTATAMKGLEPWESKPGGVRGDPLGGTTTVNPAHLQNVEGQTVPFAPAPVVYPNGNRNAGRGINNNSKPNGSSQVNAIPPIPDGMNYETDENGNIVSEKFIYSQPPKSNDTGIKTGWSPQEKQTQENYLKKETDSYNGAVKSLQNLELMQHSIDTLNQNPGFLSTGKWSEKKLEIAKSLQAAGFNAFDPDQISAGESLLKTTGRLGFDMSKQLGSREPGVITQQAIKLNPGMENTPQGIQLLKNSVQEEAQRIIDEHNFKGEYYQTSGWNQQKAEAAFDAKYKPELYAKRASSQTSPIKVNNPAAAKQLLSGTRILTPKGVKIIPPGVGITPPSYQSVQQPYMPQNNPQAEEE